MNKEEFNNLFCECVAHSKSFAQTMVTEKLSPIDSFYLATALHDSIVLGPFSTAKTTDILYGDGSFPRWVDISVLDSEEASTVFYLTHSEDRTREVEKTTYFARGQGPFGIKSPILPKDWRDVETSGRFSLKETKNKQKIEPGGSANRGNALGFRHTHSRGC
ncbi:MAG: hypothetical protein HC904_00255 [Blastochloris sp.]|nr:hypothetical protein [Blastochloris sp.]